MTPARMRRLTSDYEEVKKNFTGHKSIVVLPVGDTPPEKYHVTYFVNGIYLLPDGQIETLGRHEVEIILHAEYPRYKPICKILTPIWHPNFRDGQICIGDIWGAGESLSDIIVNIGDMIQYKSWNSYSPLSADAAQWAMENRHLFPVGNINLFYSDYASAKDEVEIDLFDDEGEKQENAAENPPATDHCESQDTRVIPEGTEAPQSQDSPDRGSSEPSVSKVLPAGAAVPAPEQPEKTASAPVGAPLPAADENDFEITAEELEGITYVPSAQRMQTVAHGGTVKGKINFKTILWKGILWALIGALLGFGCTELFRGELEQSKAASMMGYPHLSKYFSYMEKAEKEIEPVDKEFKSYCRKHDLDPDDSSSLDIWYYSGEVSDSAAAHLDKYSDLSTKAYDEIEKSYQYEFDKDEEEIKGAIKKAVRISSGLWSMIIALFIGFFLGLGEGIFYGSAQKAFLYGAIGAVVSAALGFFSGDIAQLMYAALLEDNDPSSFMSALIRGAGWAVMGVGLGLAIGLIRPRLKRILFCCLGGLIGAFLGGFVFNYVIEIIPNVIVARGVGILLTGLLIGIGVGLLEQFAKQAWLKVIRGEFEGKEYLVFSGTTSIGNNGKNTIVLFKDKLVGPHHCDIILEGSKYILVDCGTPMGTLVNGMKTTRHILRKGDAIGVGNSILVFNTK